MTCHWNQNLKKWEYPPGILPRETDKRQHRSEVLRRKPWIKTKINNQTYWGKSLQGECWEKTKIILLKILPLILKSFLLFTLPKTLPKLGLLVREIHYNTTIDHMLHER